MVSCCGGSSKVHAERAVTLLVVGASGAGKSTLLKLLQRRFEAAAAHKKKKAPSKKKGAPAPEEAPEAAGALPATRSTVGVEVENVSTPCARVMLQEVGGPMTLMWPRFYGPCAAILYVIDAADLSRLAAAWVELLMLLDDEKSRGKKVTVVLNKADAAPDATRTAKRFLRLHALDADRVSVLEGSLADATFVDDVRSVVLAAAAAPEEAPERR